MNAPIVFFFLSENPDDFPFSDATYRDSYMRFLELAKKQNIDVRFVFGKKEYKDGLFLSYWQAENNRLRQFKTSFKSGVIYLRNRTNIFDHENRINNQHLEEICRDKLKTANMFKQYSKKTSLIKPDNLSILSEFKTPLVVLKPRFGLSGWGVKVLSKNSITPEMVETEEYIVQELIDSSKGIPGLTTQRHELRMYVFNGIVKTAYIRLPAKDSYLSNISQGATEQQIPMFNIPQSAFDLVETVDQQFDQNLSRIYTVDVMFENGTPFIVELNDSPGMPDISVQPLTDTFLSALLKFLDEARTKSN